MGGHYTYDMCCALCWPIKQVHVVPLTNNLADAFGHSESQSQSLSSSEYIFLFPFSWLVYRFALWHVLCSNGVLSSTHIPHILYVYVHMHVCVIFFNLLKGHVRDTHAKWFRGDSLNNFAITPPSKMSHSNITK